MNEKIFYSEYFYQKGPKDTEILEKNASEFCFSSLASFMLLYHYKKLAHPGFENMARKTTLLFNNPHWLRFQLSEIPAPASQEAMPHPSDLPTVDPENFASDLEASTQAAQADTAPTSAGIVEDQLAEHQAELAEPAENSGTSTTTAAEETIGETPQLLSPKEIVIAPDGQHEAMPEEPEIHPGLATEELGELPPHEAPATVSSQQESMVFEPLHTVDYFASQGIRINDELVTTDKLSNQLKSFTAWLKTMKKTHSAKLPEQSLVNEQLIQNAANASNINTEVLTEAMAEVLIKQDKKEKAIEMFTKLSLINPAKSAYFAARIESIKSN